MYKFRITSCHTVEHLCRARKHFIRTKPNNHRENSTIPYDYNQLREISSECFVNSSDRKTVIPVGNRRTLRRFSRFFFYEKYSEIRKIHPVPQIQQSDDIYYQKPPADVFDDPSEISDGRIAYRPWQKKKKIAPVTTVKPIHFSLLSESKKKYTSLPMFYYNTMTPLFAGLTERSDNIHVMICVATRGELPRYAIDFHGTIGFQW